MLTVVRSIRRPLRIVLISVGLVGAVYAYSIFRCSGLERSQTIFGDFTVRCLWDHGIRTVQIFRAGTTETLSDPISRFIIMRMTKKLILEQTRIAMSTIGAVRGHAEIDMRVYGDILPCHAVNLGRPRVTDSDRKPRSPYVL
jgi:hypothetical protein